MEKAWVAALLCVAGMAQAKSCFEVSQLSGLAFNKREEFSPTKDGFAGRVFRIVIDGANSSVPEWDTPCSEVTPTTIECTKRTATTRAYELWSIDESSGFVSYTRVNAGFGPFDGSKVMVGLLSGRCDAK